MHYNVQLPTARGGRSAPRRIGEGSVGESGWGSRGELEPGAFRYTYVHD